MIHQFDHRRMILKLIELISMTIAKNDQAQPEESLPEKGINPFKEQLEQFMKAHGREPDHQELWSIQSAFGEENLQWLYSRMYFVRHGETVANEQNTFAGRHETSLSNLGIEQARQGGKKMAKKCLTFDEMHISPLMRTYETAMILLEELHQENICIFVSDLLVERDFGFYSNFNKNLMCKTVGYKTYEESLHSLKGFPPGGETFSEMYYRTMEYYREVLLPKIAMGKTILVVCHKYIMEMFAMILAEKSIEEYHDMRLPNAEALSARELKKLGQEDSKLQKEMADRTIFMGPVLIFIAAVAGAGFKAFIPSLTISRPPLLFLLGGLLAVSNFFVMLSIHPGIVKSAIMAPSFLFSRMFSPWILRLSLVAAAVFLSDDRLHGGIWLLASMPPALTAPVLSILWGGDLYTAIRITVILSCVAPLTLPIFFYGLSIDNLMILLPFTLTLFGAVFIPAGLAQWFRAWNPIRAGKIVTRWKWLSVVAVVLIVFISTNYFTPTTFLSMQCGEILAFERQGLYFLGVMGILKILAHGNRLFSRQDMPTATDLYITQATPNIFLWLSIVSMLPNSESLGFWGCLFFAGGILLDEWFFVHSFRVNLQQALCREAENFWQYKRFRSRTLRRLPIKPDTDAFEAAWDRRIITAMQGDDTA